MKKFLTKMALMLFISLISTNCLAMTFSQPIEIGKVGCPDQSPYRGIDIKSASFNNGNIIDVNHKTYGKGIARFGNGTDALYCQYNYGDGSFDTTIEYGGQNNYIVDLGWSTRYISKIQTDEGITLYTLFYNFKYSNCVIIGRLKDGKWVKYVDTNTIDEQYFGKNLFYMDRPSYNKNIICDGNTIIINYIIWKTKSKGEIHLKWDEAAQWFGVEQVVY